MSLRKSSTKDLYLVHELGCACTLATPPELRRKSENCKISEKNEKHDQTGTPSNRRHERKRQRQQEQDPQQQQKGRPAGKKSSQGNTGEHADQAQRQHKTQRARNSSSTTTPAPPQHNATPPDARPTRAEARAKPATQAPIASRPTHQPQTSPTPPKDHLALVNGSEIPNCATQQIRFWHFVTPPPTALLAAWFSGGVLLIHHLLRCPGTLVLLRQLVIPPPCYSTLTQFAGGF